MLVITPSELCAAFAIVYGAVRDFHPAFEQRMARQAPGLPPDQAWANLLSRSLVRFLRENGYGAAPASSLHAALSTLVAELGDTATRMLPLEPKAPEQPGARADEQPAVTALEEPQGVCRITLSLASAGPGDIERELRSLLKMSSVKELTLDLQSPDRWWEQVDPRPDWRTPDSARTVDTAARLAAIGEALLRLFGTGQGGRATLAARQHIGLEQGGVDPVIHADVRPLMGRYQAGWFVRQRRAIPAGEAAYTGPLKLLVPAGVLPWLEPTLLELQARPSTELSVEPGHPWAAYGQIVPLPGNLVLEVRRWSLLSQAESGLPSPVVQAEATGKTAAEDDRQTVQMGSLLALHHILRTYNPYFDPVDDDARWADHLWAAAQAVMATPNGLTDASFGVTLWEFAAAFPGGHTRTLGPDRSRSMPFLPGEMAPPALLECTTENEVVVGLPLADCGLLPGDLILEVDGEDAGARFNRYLHHLRVYTPGTARLYAARWLLAGPPATTVRVTIRRDGETLSMTRRLDLARGRSLWDLLSTHSFPDGEPVRLIDRGGVLIGYVDLGRVGAGEFERALDRVSDASALVLDMRGYPKAGPPDFSRFFPPGGSYTLTARRPVLNSPVGWQGSRSGWLEDRRPYVDSRRTGGDHRPIAALCSGLTASEAELVVDQLRATGRAILVGTQTKGAAGAPVWADLPGGGRVQFSGSAVSCQGAPFMEGRGLKPDLERWPTRAGLKARRDEVLEEACRLLLELLG